jgi:hypothetical protein
MERERASERDQSARAALFRLPVGVGTNVVDEGAVLQNRLHLAQGHVLSCLQLHQVLLTVYRGAERGCWFILRQGGGVTKWHTGGVTQLAQWKRILGATKDHLLYASLKIKTWVFL